MNNSCSSTQAQIYLECAETANSRPDQV